MKLSFEDGRVIGERDYRDEDDLREEVESLRRAIAVRDEDAVRLRAAVERVTRESLDLRGAALALMVSGEEQQAEIARLRAALATALVPCPECGGSPHQDNGDGTTSVCECAYHDTPPGYVPAVQP